jgi:hypothetical protein
MTPEQFMFYFVGTIVGKEELNKEEVARLSEVANRVCTRIVDAQTPRMMMPGLQAYSARSPIIPPETPNQ